MRPKKTLRVLFGEDTECTDKITLEREDKEGRIAFAIRDQFDKPKRSGLTPRFAVPGYGYEGVLAISTGHVPPPGSYRGRPGEDVDFGGEDGPRVLKFKHGWILFVTQDIESCSDWLVPIMKYAVELECTLILFDADANQNPDFKEYDW